MSEITYTTIQGKSVAVTLKDKKRWENNTTLEQRNDPDFKWKFGNDLIEKSKTLVEPNKVSEITNQRQSVPEKSLQESSKSIYDDIDESEFTKDRGNWRSYPTDEQLQKLKDVGYDGPPPNSSRQANEIIGKRIPPSEKSKNFLNKLNYNDKYPTTEFDAINLIDQLRPPTENQLKEIRKLGGNDIPQSHSEAHELIFSLTPVSIWQNKFLREHDLEIPENKKEAHDIIDEYLYGTSIQSVPCPKCKGEKTLFYGGHYHECPYCSGTGHKEDFDENIGDKKIYDEENKEFEDTYYSEDTDSELTETNDSYQNVGEELNWKKNFYDN